MQETCILQGCAPAHHITQLQLPLQTICQASFVNMRDSSLCCVIVQLQLALTLVGIVNQHALDGDRRAFF